jgi:hypothetical protein
MSADLVALIIVIVLLVFFIAVAVRVQLTHKERLKYIRCNLEEFNDFFFKRLGYKAECYEATCYVVSRKTFDNIRISHDGMYKLMNMPKESIGTQVIFEMCSRYPG